MKRYKGTLNAYYCVKGTNLKRLPTIQYQLYVQEKSKCGNSKKDAFSGC